MKIDKFVIAIIITVIAAYIYPDLGKGESAQVLNTLSSIGISLIFFFYGLKLSPQQIKIGLKNWKLHVLIQATTFIVFPLIVLTVYPLITEDNKALWLAFMFLAALPSTVSSSVVMVSIAKGNIPAAIFNASISGLIGVHDLMWRNGSMEARGIAMLCAAKNNMPVFEYSAKKVKQAVTGNGNADKGQIQYMIKQIFKLKILPTPLDASDAIGIALCHLNQMKVKEI